MVLIILAIGGFILYKNNNSGTYKVDQKEFNISKNNTNPKETTEGINKAIQYAKENNYKIIKVPKGHCSIYTSVTNPIEVKDAKRNTWTHNR